MTHWKNCRMETFHHDGASDVELAEVTLNDNEVVVSYDVEDGVQIYRGKNEKTGHFHLRNGSTSGRATLHFRTEGEDVLEGSWTEDDLSGMWSIELN